MLCGFGEAQHLRKVQVRSYKCYVVLEAATQLQALSYAMWFWSSTAPQKKSGLINVMLLFVEF